MIKFPAMSLFAKITWLAFIASLLTGAIVFYFVNELFSEFQERSRERRFSEHIASELILENPSPSHMSAVSNQTGLVIRYRGPDGERFAGNAPRFEDVRPVRRIHSANRRAGPPQWRGLNDAILVRGLSGRPYLLRRQGHTLVLVGHKWSAFRDSAWSVAPKLLGGLAGSLLMVWAGFYFLQRRLLAPLSRLRRDMAAVGDGEWREADETRRDEFGRLAAVFNGMQKRLRDLLQSKQRLLASASHELRSPLTRLKLAAEFVPEGRLRGRMDADLRELESLTGGILEQSRMEMLPAETTAVDLDALARDEIERYDGSEKEVAMDLRSGAVVMADGTRLRRALRVLVDNGLKYAAGRVLVSSRRLADGRGELRVEDDGPGVSAEDLPHLFEAFYRADKARTPDGSQGFGLGLALAKAAVESQGGELAAWNNPRGGGLTMAIRLPERGEGEK